MRDTEILCFRNSKWNCRCDRRWARRRRWRWWLLGRRGGRCSGRLLTFLNHCVLSSESITWVTTLPFYSIFSEVAKSGHVASSFVIFSWNCYMHGVKKHRMHEKIILSWEHPLPVIILDTICKSWKLQANDLTSLFLGWRWRNWRRSGSGRDRMGKEGAGCSRASGCRVWQGFGYLCIQSFFRSCD